MNLRLETEFCYHLVVFYRLRVESVTMKFWLVFVCSFLVNFLPAQEINWHVKPTITDVDRIILSDFEILKKPKVIKVKKGAYFGFKNTDDQIVVPIKYKGYSQVFYDDIIYVKINSKEYYYDQSGSLLKEADAQIAYEKNRLIQRKRIVEKYSAELLKNGIRSSASKEYDFLNIEYGSKSISVSIDSLNYLRSFNNKSILINGAGKNRLYTYVDGLKYDFKDTEVIPQGAETFYVKRDKHNGYMDNNFDFLIPLGDHKISVYGEDGLAYINEDGEGVFLNIEGIEKLRLKDVESIQSIKETSYVSIKHTDGRVKILNLSTGELKNLDFELHLSNIRGLDQIASKNGKRGVVNISTLDQLIPFSYDKLSQIDHVYLGYNLREPTKEELRKKPKSKPKLKNGIRYLHRLNGELLLRDSINRVSRLNKMGVLVNLASKQNKIYDLNYDEIEYKELAKRALVAFSGYFIKFDVELEKPSAVYHYCLSNKFINREKYELYQKVGKKINYEGKNYFPVKKNEKYGVIDETGRVVVPFVLDVVSRHSVGPFIEVRYNGSLGVINLSEQ